MCLWKLNGWIEYLSCRRRASSGLCQTTGNRETRGRLESQIKLRERKSEWLCLIKVAMSMQSSQWQWCWLCAVYANVFLKVDIRSRAAHDNNIGDRASVLHVKGEQMAFLCILLVCIYSCIAYCHLFNLHFIYSSGPMVHSTTLFPDQRKNDNEPFFKLQSIHWVEKLFTKLYCTFCNTYGSLCSCGGILYNKAHWLIKN